MWMPFGHTKFLLFHFLTPTQSRFGTRTMDLSVPAGAGGGQDKQRCLPLNSGLGIIVICPEIWYRYIIPAYIHLIFTRFLQLKCRKIYESHGSYVVRSQCRGHIIIVPLGCPRKLKKGEDQWVISPQYTPFTTWLYPIY